MRGLDENRLMDRSAAMVVLNVYSMLAVALVLETLAMDWDILFVPLIVGCLGVSWTLHIRKILTDSQRIWVNALFCMAGFVFYGLHLTSMFDMVGVTMVLLIAFTMSGEPNLNALTVLTYYVTLFCDVIQLNMQHFDWNTLFFSRVLLNCFAVLVAGRLARTISRQWTMLLHGADREIAALNETTRMMDVFLANLSHELRTPVNMILGSAGVARDGTTDPALRTSLSEIHDAGERVKGQVEDILDFSEVEMASLTVNTEIYMLSSLLNDLAVNLRSMIPPNLELVLDVDPDIPAALRSDPIKLRRILYHLIRNALQYTREGGVYVHFSCVRREYGVNLCVQVTDTGVGMTEEETAMVTTGFYKAKSGSVRSGGLGIGLAVVSGFVSVLGGFLSISSEPGKGTTVRVSIPQEVTDEGRCMTVSHPERLRAVFFYEPSAVAPKVREFYDAMYQNISRGVRVPLLNVETAEKLERVVKKNMPSHIIVEKQQYEAHRERIEELAKQCVVALLVNGPYELPPDSRVRIVEKPFFCYPLFGVLELSPDDSLIEDDRVLVCRDVHALVVDDEPMNIKVATSILRRHGITADKASSGAEAVLRCGEQAFDLIFMDHMMPGMDGVEAMKRIRADDFWREHPCPFIILTANTLSTAREMFEREGFDAFVAKPIDRVELERALKRVLPGSKVSYEKPGAAAGKGGSGAGGPSAPRQSAPAAQQSAPAAQQSAPAPQPDEAKRAPGLGGKWGAMEAAGVDIRMGLQYSMDDEDFYTSVLQDYLDGAAEKRANLESYMSGGDCANYAIVVHALKSTSLMIGAAELSAKAKALEAAARQGDKAYIEANHRETMDLYAAVTDAIAATVRPGGAPAASGGGDDELLEFSPGGGDAPSGGDTLEFAPGGDVLDFAPSGGGFDFGGSDFAPSGGLEFGPSGGPASGPDAALTGFSAGAFSPAEDSGGSFEFAAEDGGSGGGSFEFAAEDVGNAGGGSFELAAEDAGSGGGSFELAEEDSKTAGGSFEFAAEDGGSAGGTIDFAPGGARAPGGDVMEFSPGGELMDFAPGGDVFEFQPEEG